jgi:hypothetical protein
VSFRSISRPFRLNPQQYRSTKRRWDILATVPRVFLSKGPVKKSVLSGKSYYAGTKKRFSFFFLYYIIQPCYIHVIFFALRFELLHLYYLFQTIIDLCLSVYVDIIDKASVLFGNIERNIQNWLHVVKMNVLDGKSKARASQTDSTVFINCAFRLMWARWDCNRS